MTPHNELRLLPWSGPDGKPCYLSTDSNDSHLSRLADNSEEIQLSLAAALVTHALEVLSGEGPQTEELRRLSADLAEALKYVMRVAASRGHACQHRT
jgi:formylmethanofuran dehydrogenase subunit B